MCLVADSHAIILLEEDAVVAAIKCEISGSGTRAASGRRRPAQDHAFIACRRVPSPPPGMTPAPIEEVTQVDNR